MCRASQKEKIRNPELQPVKQQEPRNRLRKEKCQVDLKQDFLKHYTCNFVLRLSIRIIELKVPKLPHVLRLLPLYQWTIDEKAAASKHMEVYIHNNEYLLVFLIKQTLRITVFFLFFFFNYNSFHTCTVDVTLFL